MRHLVKQLVGGVEVRAAKAHKDVVGMESVAIWLLPCESMREREREREVPPSGNWEHSFSNMLVICFKLVTPESQIKCITNSSLKFFLREQLCQFKESILDASHNLLNK